jgi:hypothetical protein
MVKLHLQNRVDPMGELHSHSSKAATLMGNRGILHDGDRNIVRKWVGNSWVACNPNFKGIDRRPLFQPHSYSELFFLDEVTAYSAGHRPCWECRREQYVNFKSSWEKHFTDGEPLLIKQIDKQLHSDRTIRGGKKLTYDVMLSDLPNGTIVEIDGTAYLVQGKKLLEWSFNGYIAANPCDANLTVKVLTPKSIVDLFQHGLSADVHSTADRFL